MTCGIRQIDSNTLIRMEKTSTIIEWIVCEVLCFKKMDLSASWNNLWATNLNQSTSISEIGLHWSTECSLKITNHIYTGFIPIAKATGRREVETDTVRTTNAATHQPTSHGARYIVSKRWLCGGSILSRTEFHFQSRKLTTAKPLNVFSRNKDVNNTEWLKPRWCCYFSICIKCCYGDTTAASRPPLKLHLNQSRR